MNFLFNNPSSSSSQADASSVSSPSASQLLLLEYPSAQHDDENFGEMAFLPKLSEMFPAVDLETIKQTILDERARLSYERESDIPSPSSSTSSYSSNSKKALDEYEDTVLHAAIEKLLLLQVNGTVHTAVSLEPVCILGKVGDEENDKLRMEAFDTGSGNMATEATMKQHRSASSSTDDEGFMIDPQWALNDVAVVVKKKELEENEIDNEVEEEKGEEEELKELLVNVCEDIAEIESPAREKCLRVLLKLVSNVLSDPENMKFRSIKLTNQTIATALMPHDSAMIFLQVVGFHSSSSSSADDGAAAKVDVLQMPEPSVELLSFSKEKIESLCERFPGSSNDSRTTSCVLSDAAPKEKEMGVAEGINRRNPSTTTKKTSAFAFSSRSRGASDLNQNEQNFQQQLAEVRKAAAQRNLSGAGREMKFEKSQQKAQEDNDQQANSPKGLSQKIIPWTTVPSRNLRRRGGRGGRLRFSGFSGHASPAAPAASAASPVASSAASFVSNFDYVDYYADAYRGTVQKRPAHSITDLRMMDFDPEYIGRQVLDFTNKYRVKMGYSTLFWSQELSRIGLEHSKNMAARIVPFGHAGVAQRFARYPFHSVHSGENVAYNAGVYNVAEYAVNQWIESPGHEKNLRGDYTVCGIGVHRDRMGGFYLTQLFGSHG